MPGPTRRTLALLLLGGALLSGSLIALAAPGGGPAASVAKALRRAPALATVRPRPRGPVAGFDPLSQRLEGAKLVSDLPDGKRAELTLDRGLQAHVAGLLRSYEV